MTRAYQWTYRNAKDASYGRYMKALDTHEGARELHRTTPESLGRNVELAVQNLLKVLENLDDGASIEVWLETMALYLGMVEADLHASGMMVDFDCVPSARRNDEAEGE